MRFLFRFLSFLALVAAVLAGTVDAVRSMSESAPVMTPMGAAIASLNTSELALVEALERPDGGLGLIQPAVRWVLQQPAFALLLIVALLFWMAGYRPARGRAAA